MLIHWNFDPILLSLGPIALRWYGLLFVGAFFVGRFILARTFEREGEPTHTTDRLMFFGLIGTMIGARVVHCAFYDPAYYWAHPLEIPMLWRGGLASHGGVIGLLVGLWYVARSERPRRPFLWLIDRVAIPGAIGGMFIRIANFLNSEIVGVPTGGDWGVVFEAVDAAPRHPAQLYEAAAYALTAAILALVYRRDRAATPHGVLAGLLLTLIFAARIAIEPFKTAQAAYEAGQTFSVGQYLSVPFVLVGLVLIAFALKRGAPPLASQPGAHESAAADGASDPRP